MRYSKVTLAKIEAARKDGATIVENKNWKYTGKRDGFTRVEKLAQTNDRYAGRPQRIVWACWR